MQIADKNKITGTFHAYVTLWPFGMTAARGGSHNFPPEQGAPQRVNRLIVGR
jgi:hypothetical protein